MLTDHNNIFNEIKHIFFYVMTVFGFQDEKCYIENDLDRYRIHYILLY
jgi:hypothetical protein